MTTASTSKALTGCTKQAYHDAYMQACQKLGDVRKQNADLLAALEAMRRNYDADSARTVNQSVAGDMADAAIAAAKGGTA